MDKKQMQEAVKAHYAKAALENNAGCGSSSCCKSSSNIANSMSRSLGYSQEDLEAVPEGANLGLGCGNPTAIAGLAPGETVLDLGSGAGFDAFLAARQVGDSGKVYGVDMTDEMLEKARNNAARSGFGNVEFLKGQIEEIPLPDKSVDVIISNCVVNLCPDKEAVYREAFRVLKPGGRVEISDVVAFKDLPNELKDNLHLISACVGGAITKAETEEIMKKAGFRDVEVIPREETREAIENWGLSQEIANSVTSAHIKGRKG